MNTKRTFLVIMIWRVVNVGLIRIRLQMLCRVDSVAHSSFRVKQYGTRSLGVNAVSNYHLLLWKRERGKDRSIRLRALKLC